MAGCVAGQIMIIKKWYILAGGSATRWGGYQGVKNKCYVKIDGETLIDRTIRLLKKYGVSDYEVILKGYDSKRAAFEGIAKKARKPFGILLGDCYYTDAIIKDATSREVETWQHYYNCLPNPWTGCPWEEGYIHLVPNWEWWLEKMTEFNQKCDSGEIHFGADYQIDRYLRGYSPDEYRGATLDEHDIFWSDETDDLDYPKDYDMFIEHHTKNKAGYRDDKLSVIIPHYNTGRRLQKLLDKLIYQKTYYYPETEIIVIDDGSNAANKPPLMPAVKTIYQPNRGVSNARNVGLKASTGRYITFVDADDDITDDYLHTVYQIMRQGYDYAIYPFYVVSENTTGYPREQLIGNYAVWAWSYTWACINGQEFDESLNVAEDVDWLRRVITEDKKGYKADKFIYRYDWNANPDSLSKRFNRGDLPHKK